PALVLRGAGGGDAHRPALPHLGRRCAHGVPRLLQRGPEGLGRGFRTSVLGRSEQSGALPRVPEPILGCNLPNLRQSEVSAPLLRHAGRPGGEGVLRERMASRARRAAGGAGGLGERGPRGKAGALSGLPGGGRGHARRGYRAQHADRVAGADPLLVLADPHRALNASSLLEEPAPSAPTGSQEPVAVTGCAPRPTAPAASAP